MVRICCFAAICLLAATPGMALAQNEPNALPEYRPVVQVGGSLRSRGSANMADLMRRWQAGFRKYHPEVQFENSLRGSASGMYGLEMRTADMALMGRPINPYERYGVYERSWVFPVEVEVATGDFATAHNSPAYAILVHKDNPITKVTLQQLDGIFGAQREGGWSALSWDEAAARGKELNIRTWGELGVEGPLADESIHVYGPPLLGAGVVTPFQTIVLQGGAMWNEDLREYANREAMVAALADDPNGIAYTALSYANEGVKPLAVGATAAGPFVELSEASVADRSYPLARSIYVVFTIDDEHAEFADPGGDPRVREFLRYILSRQGQDDVRDEGTYLPLTADMLLEQRRKIDSPRGTPKERQLVTH